jgi:hypothetical protein
LTEKDQAKKLEKMKVDLAISKCKFITNSRIFSQSFMDPIDKTTIVCPVPTLNGSLISLKHVYNSWKNDGVRNVLDTMPPFTMPNVPGIVTLASSCQINLIHQISHEFGISVEPPFKIQYKQGEDDTWVDIFFTDQILIASVMYQMKHGPSAMERRLVQNNQMLITINLEQQVFKFDLKNTAQPPMTEIPCRLIAIDPAFDIY